MHAFARQRVEHDGEGCRQRLTFAGAHFGDRAAVEHHPTDQLDIEVAHPHAPLANLADDCETLRKQVVERLAALRAFAQAVHPRTQLLVAVELELGLEGADQNHALLVAFEQL